MLATLGWARIPQTETESRVIVWLASYPRSGNTFLRIVPHRLYGLPTYSVYEDDDPVAQRIGPDLVGWRPKPGDRKEMIAAPGVHFAMRRTPAPEGRQHVAVGVSPRKAVR